MERARVVEECFWELSELLDVERIERPGWLEIAADAAGELRNGVLRSVVPEEEIEAAIGAAVARFAARGTPFRWHLGPSARPADLDARLAANGFEHADTLIGMCIDTARDVVPPDPAIAVTELLPSEAEAFVDVVTAGTGAPAGFRDRLLADIRSGKGEGKQRHYVARLDGEIVGATTLAQMRHAGFLQGATVSEGSRGRGVYRQMIKTRLEALRTEGFDLAVITAREGTSAPICARVGFEAVCTIEVYRHP